MTEDPIAYARAVDEARREQFALDARKLADTEAEIRDTWPKLTPRQLTLVAQVLIEARRSDRLGWREATMRRCPICEIEQRDGVPAVDFAVRPVILPNHPAIGCCVACAMDLTLAVFIDLFSTLAVVLPENGKLGTNRYRWVDLVTCPQCDWTGPISYVGFERKLSGLGRYPSRCPSCGWRRRPLDPDDYPVVGHELQRISL